MSNFRSRPAFAGKGDPAVLLPDKMKDSDRRQRLPKDQLALGIKCDAERVTKYRYSMYSQNRRLNSALSK